MTNSAAIEKPSLESLVAEIADEFMARLERGEQPEIEEYVQRYPQHETVIRQVLSSLRLIRLSAASSQATLPPLDSADQPVGRLGDFRILREVGRGGMGVVYEAEQLSLGRRVALKVLPFAGAFDPKQLQRFKNEAQAAAQLHHQHIVPVYAVGCERGVHYYAMQFVEGQSLAGMIAELRSLAGLKGGEEPGSSSSASGLVKELVSGRWAPLQPNGANLAATSPYTPRPADVPQNDGRQDQAPREADTPAVAGLSTDPSTKSPAFFRTVATLGVQAAEALEHAHQMGIIHRDIKPANLLVDLRGSLWVTDFGLAQFQTDTRLTMTGDLVGTLRYMSPEQALAKRIPIDHRTDIYSLGVTLYELMTLEPVFSGTDRQELLRQVAFEEPKPPRRWNRSIPSELETIVLKAIAKNPAERYASAQEVADDLHRFLEDRPIKAKRTSLLQHVVKWSRRHKPIVYSAAASLFAVLAITIGALAISNLHIKEEQRQTKSALDRETQANEALKAALAREKRTGYIRSISLAYREWLANRVPRVEEILDACPPELRNWEWHYLKRLCRIEMRLPTPLNHCYGLAFSADGRRVACSGVLPGRIVDPQTVPVRDSQIMVWDAATGHELLTVTMPEVISHVALSPDGRHLAATQLDKSVRIWDVETGEEVLWLPGHKGHTRKLLYSSDGQRLASAGLLSGADYAGEAKVWDAASGREICSFRGQVRFGSNPHMAFTPDGQRIAISVGYGQVFVHDATTGRRLTDLPFLSERLLMSLDPGPLAYSGDKGQFLAIARSDGAYKTRDLVNNIDRSFHRVFGRPIQFVANNQLLAARNEDGAVTLWDVLSAKEQYSIRGAGVEVVFSEDGQRVAAFQDTTVQVWDLTRDREVDIYRQKPPRPSLFQAVSADGRLLATSAADATIAVSEVATGQELHKLQEHTGNVEWLSFHPNGQRLASASVDGTVKIWELSTKQGRVLFTLKGHRRHARWVAYSPDGVHLATVGDDGIVRIWDADTGTEVRVISPEGDPPPAGPDRAPGAHPGAEKKPLDRFAPNFFAYDGKHLVLRDEHRIKVVESATGKVILNLLEHTNFASGMALSHDGKWLVAQPHDQSATRAGELQLWEVATGRKQRAFRGHSGHVPCLAFHPDGSRLVTASGDGTIRLWDVATGEELLAFRPPSEVGATAYTLLAFSPDGKRLFWGNRHGTVAVWSSTSAKAK